MKQNLMAVKPARLRTALSFGVTTGVCALLLTNSLQMQPKAEAKPATKTKVKKTSSAKMQWRTSLPAALQEAKRTGKPIMIDFYATWCGPCKMLDQHVYTNAAVIKESRNWIVVKIDAEKQAALAQQYNVTGYPTLMYLKPNGSVLKRQSGLSVPTQHQTSMSKALSYIRQDTLRTMRTLRQRAVVISA